MGLWLITVACWGQKFAVKTNAAYWAAATLNAGMEVAVSPRMTIDLAGNYNPFRFRHNKKWMHWALQPEWRWWTCQRFMGHFFGVYLQGGQYNAGLKKYRYDGWLAGAGISYGYQWWIGKRWNLETALGIGYVYFDFNRYWRENCGKYVNSGHRNYIGPTKLSLSLMYFIKTNK